MYIVLLLASQQPAHKTTAAAAAGAAPPDQIKQLLASLTGSAATLVPTNSNGNGTSAELDKQQEAAQKPAATVDAVFFLFLAGFTAALVSILRKANGITAAAAAPQAPVELCVVAVCDLQVQQRHSHLPMATATATAYWQSSMNSKKLLRS